MVSKVHASVAWGVAKLFGAKARVDEASWDSMDATTQQLFVRDVISSFDAENAPKIEVVHQGEVIGTVTAEDDAGQPIDGQLVVEDQGLTPENETKLVEEIKAEQ